MKNKSLAILMAVIAVSGLATSASFAENEQNNTPPNPGKETPKEKIDNGIDVAKSGAKHVWHDAEHGAKKVGSHIKSGSEKIGQGIEKEAHKAGQHLHSDKDSLPDKTDNQ